MFVQCDGYTKNKKRCGNHSKFVTENNQHYCGVHIKQCSDKTLHTDLVDCIVCYNQVSVKKATQTICQHLFCKSCLNKWLRRNHTCPLCRTVLRDPDSESENTDLETTTNQFITELVHNNQIVFMDNNLYITIDLSEDQLRLLEQWNNHVVTIEHLIHLLP